MTAHNARTPGPLGRNISPARKYPTLFAGRNTHVAVLDTVGKTDTEIEANADYMVLAWNAHDELVAALESIADTDYNSVRVARDIARRALARLKGVRRCPADGAGCSLSQCKSVCACRTAINPTEARAALAKGRPE